MSKIELDRNNKTLYGQIADILRERIMSGEFKPGDILPSERELAEEMQGNGYFHRHCDHL